MSKILRDCRCGNRIIGGQIVDRLVGEDDSPAKGDAPRISFEQADFMARIAQFHRDGEIETRRSPADAGDPHGHGLALPAPTTQSLILTLIERRLRCTWQRGQFADCDSRPTEPETSRFSPNRQRWKVGFVPIRDFRLCFLRLQCGHEYGRRLFDESAIRPPLTRRKE